MNNYIKPGSTIGIIGGGQLGKMLAQSAKRMGYRVGIFDPGQNCSASQVADFHCQAAFDDQKRLAEFAHQVDVLTFEFENISLESLNKIVEEGAYLPQGSEILRLTQDRLTEKEFLRSSGVPVADYYPVNSYEELKQGLEQLNYPAVLKTRRFGYDGKGQIMIKSERDIEEAKQLIDSAPCILEAFVPFNMELSHMVVRNKQGQTSIFPLSENIHYNHILHQSIVPARVSETVANQAFKVAETIAYKLNLVGIVGIEMFLADDKILVNELAPRPHNSGHYTIEACQYSQFDLHIRSICGMTLPQNKLLSPVVMTNILGQDQEMVIEQWPNHPDWHLHLYGKGEARQDRKMGHITQLDSNPESILKTLKKIDNWSYKS
ncbi:5-(carboxyamino)imidazole ribonucleotide synthase [Facklamia sp. 7083-14-GEN3]|uniref:5-(carboxyamino)imidazole ribonucleotide synthase n=1 Tax=Facklamia sp. 7083-14-GEN3 TaxID=2973478 RepID=UPI00215C95A5|nr:5-(carboxyamino)imidazole ribonucleotide synthase [Facklamia sp. 7083-14-GEN3]MCR8968810.1 5-(carboxyamino)imidazole ribonucleotide synthase [Facklamia sp. 7083-14-GEN3]